MVLKGARMGNGRARLDRKRAEYGISREMICSIALRIKYEVLLLFSADPRLLMNGQAT